MNLSYFSSSIKLGLGFLALLFSQNLKAQSVSLSEPSYSGSGCRAGTVRASLSPDNSSLSILFDEFRIDAGSDIGVAESRANCSIRINMQVPDGYQLMVSQIDYRGFADLSQGTQFSLITDAFWMPSQNQRLTANLSGPYSDNFFFRHSIQNTSIGGCHRDQTLAFNTQLALAGQSQTVIVPGFRGMRIPRVINQGVQGRSQALIDSSEVSSEVGEESNSIHFAIQLRACSNQPVFPQPRPPSPHFPFPGRGGFVPGFITPEKADMLTNLLYEGLLFRAPDSSGIYTYRNLIMSQGINGLRNAASSIMNSAEWRNITRPNRSIHEIVEQLYQVLLGRGVDPSGLQTYSNLIAAGQQARAVDALIMSDEFRSKNLQ